MPRHGFLFGDNKGPWSTEQLTNALTRETGTRLGFRMTVQEYRHIATAIDRKFIRRQDAEPDDDDEEDGDDHVHDLMAAHSSKLANARYARMGGLTRSLTSESISIFRTISDKWQTWYKLEIRRKKNVEVKSETGVMAAENGPTGYNKCTSETLRSGWEIQDEAPRRRSNEFGDGNKPTICYSTDRRREKSDVYITGDDSRGQNDHRYYSAGCVGRRYVEKMQGC